MKRTLALLLCDALGVIDNRAPSDRLSKWRHSLYDLYLELSFRD